MENKPKIEFGFGKLRTKTPAPVKNAYRILMLLSAIWVVVIEPQFDFPEHVVYLINKWLLVGNNAFYTICQFAGYKIPGKYK